MFDDELAASATGRHWKEKPPPSPPVPVANALRAPGALVARIMTPPLAQRFVPKPLLSTQAMIVPSPVRVL